MFFNLRFAFRQLTHKPGFTAVVVLTLALGIGAATTLFSALHALVLNPFPYPDAEQIVYVRSNTGQPLSYPDFKDIQTQSQSFSDFGVYQPARINFGLEKTESLAAIKCTAGVLPALAVKPALGRWLSEADQQTGAAPVAVISHALWMRSFNGDSAIIGRTVRLDGQLTEIVGVMPAQFEFSSPWYRGEDYAVWSPLHFDPDDESDTNGARGNHWLLGMARLKPGVSLAVATSEIKAIGARLALKYPETNTHKPMLIRSLGEEITSETRSGMGPLVIAVALLLLVACTNVAGLLLARGTRRQAEFKVRLALGASRGALVRQLLTEALVLGVIGCAVGILFATWGVLALRQLIPSALIIEARRAAIEINGWVLLFAVVAGLVTAITSALMPALMAARTSMFVSINDGLRSQIGSRLRSQWLRYLVAIQTAITVVLVYAAILFTASYFNVFKDNRALDTDRVLTAEIATQGERYAEVGARIRFWNTLLDRVKALPGVENVGLTTKLPLEGGNNFNVLVDEQKFDPAIRRPLVENTGISPDYFAAMGVGWLRGTKRDFTTVQGEQFPIVINEEMARECWPDTDPIGRSVRLDMPHSPFIFRVVGVVENLRQWGAEGRPRSELYYVCTLPFTPKEALTEHGAFLTVRTASDAHVLVPTLRQQLALVDPNLSLSRIRTMSEVLRSAGSRRRLSTSLVDAFTVLALILAAVGIYGTFSYIVSERTREIGVRMAIGAQREQIFSLILRQAGLWILGGLVPGIFASIACSFVLRAMVYAANPLSPAVFLLGTSAVGCVAIVACIAPTFRATRINPVDALRAE